MNLRVVLFLDRPDFEDEDENVEEEDARRSRHANRRRTVAVPPTVGWEEADGEA